jgi:CheY-like chemotaxis protein
VLERQGYEVLEARNRQQALELLQHTKAHVRLLVTDVVMPEMRGPALVARLRELNLALPILSMSGYAERAVVHNGLVKLKEKARRLALPVERFSNALEFAEALEATGPLASRAEIAGWVWIWKRPCSRPACPLVCRFKRRHAPLHHGQSSSTLSEAARGLPLAETATLASHGRGERAVGCRRRCRSRQLGAAPWRA